MEHWIKNQYEVAFGSRKISSAIKMIFKRNESTNEERFLIPDPSLETKIAQKKTENARECDRQQNKFVRQTSSLVGSLKFKRQSQKEKDRRPKIASVLVTYDRNGVAGNLGNCNRNDSICTRRECNSTTV
ncbi:uncharacterized protein LOC132703966 [Cylas formicarius]|uniref:uncharacterized protein LOC132697242 n=1 Tax=Cylas formicarius TaxID=197179 RepID=UPI0029584011|nr:uncharacterized protein LOC132697242 [Cylas formicarius]XP_060529525.1 uncharacterized protein LOC132703966 [Cylas formicarius]